MSAYAVGDRVRVTSGALPVSSNGRGVVESIDRAPDGCIWLALDGCEGEWYDIWPVKEGEIEHE